MRTTATVVIAAGILAATAAFSAPDETRMVASDGGQYDAFGDELASDGDHLIVGASRYPPRGGAAYIYAWDGASWGNGVKLLATNHTRKDFFGSDVDVSGEHAVVGAREHDPVDSGIRNNKYGAAYFFRHADEGWIEESFVQASDRELNHEFGGAVAIAGEYAVVAAKFSSVEGRVSQGKAYVFKYEDGKWTETQILVAPDGVRSDNFGDSVDIDGDYIFVGATNHRIPQPDGPNVGAVWVFKRNPNNRWDFETRLSPSDLEDGNAFGSSIAIDGDSAIVGAALAHGNETGSGTAYIFKLGADGWEQEARLAAKAGLMGDELGHRVAIFGDHAVVGARTAAAAGVFQRGAAYVFRRTSGGWSERAKLTASDGSEEDLFGSAVAIGAGQVIVGASGRVGAKGGLQTGAMYVYNGVLEP